MRLQSIEGIGPATEEKLNSAGITTVEQLAEADGATLAERSGIAVSRLETFINRAESRDVKSGSPAELIDVENEALPDWQGDILTRIRRLIEEVDPEAVEEVKWRKPLNPQGVRVWSHDGIVCTGETYLDKVKLTFPKGASLADPAGLFNASLDGRTRRAIDIYEGEEIDEMDFKALVHAAVSLNLD